MLTFLSAIAFAVFLMLVALCAWPGLMRATLNLWKAVSRIALAFSMWAWDVACAVEDGAESYEERRKDRAKLEAQELIHCWRERCGK